MSSILIRRANMVGGSPVPPQPVEVDLTSLFTWSSGADNGQGGNPSSSVFKRSSTIDVSTYAGKTMKVTWCAYNSSSGAQVSYNGLFFYDSNGTKISSVRVPKAEGYPNGTGYSMDDHEIEIPSNAVDFKTMYFADTVSFTISTFSCKIVL